MKLDFALTLGILSEHDGLAESGHEPGVHFVLRRHVVDRRRRQHRELDHVERHALRGAAIAQSRQRLDRPARRIRAVLRVSTDVVDAVALEMLQATKIGGTALTPEYGAGRTPGWRRLGARGSARSYGAQPGQPGYRDEPASFHRSRPRQSLPHARASALRVRGAAA